jgi:hypothetical protein
MVVTVLAVKAAIAVLLVSAGGAKLADLAGFTSAVRLLAPGFIPQPAVRALAGGIASGEVAVGAASLTSPALGWLNLVVLAVCCGFAAVSAAGYIWHREQACRCFGALSKRTFNAAGLYRAVLLAACAVVATVHVRPSLIQLGPLARLALLGGCLLVAASAARAAGPKWAS